MGTKEMEDILNFLESKSNNISAFGVFYIEKVDKEGYHIEDMDEDYCINCIDNAVKSLKEKEPEFDFIPRIESMVEDSCWRTCEKCGQQLWQSFIISKSPLNMKEILDDINESLSDIKDKNQISDTLAFRIIQIVEADEELLHHFEKNLKRIFKKYNKQELQLIDKACNTIKNLLSEITEVCEEKSGNMPQMYGAIPYEKRVRLIKELELIYNALGIDADLNIPDYIIAQYTVNNIVLLAETVKRI